MCMATGTIHRQCLCHMLGGGVHGDDHAVLRPQTEQASAQRHSGDRGSRHERVILRSPFFDHQISF